MMATVIPMILGCSESSFRRFMFRPTVLVLRKHMVLAYLL
jgi:hypothetical protein